MASKTEAAYGGIKGLSFLNPKADGFNKRRQGRDRNKKRHPTSASPVKSNFTGLTDELKGSICNVSTGSQAHQFIATMKAVVIYVG